MPDLWPTDFGPTNGDPPPILLLREQADLIATHTGGRIVGKVVSESRRDNTPGFVHRLVLTAPYLDNYAYVLLNAYHPVELYPLEIHAPGANQEQAVKCRGHAEFETALRNILASEKVRKVITAILAQSDAVAVTGS